MKKILLGYLFTTITTALLAQNGIKKVIEHGWNYRDVSQLKTELPQMQNTAFDGVSFSIRRYPINVFDTISLEDDYFQFDILPTLVWNKLTDNFIYLWGASTSGGHWLSDTAWETVLSNTRKISKAIKLSNAKGVLFDNEYYYNDPKNDAWKYKPEWYNGMSYKQVAAVVKKRGIQFIEALESSKPDVKILFLSMFGSIIDQAQKTLIADNTNALYLPFIDGILTEKSNSSTIIDGNEHSYYYTKAEEYQKSKLHLHSSGQTLLPENKSVGQISIGQSIFYDGIYMLFPYNKDKNIQEKNKSFVSALKNALANTDEYVWIYSEKLNWWQPAENTSVVKFILSEIRKQKNNTK